MNSKTSNYLEPVITIDDIKEKWHIKDDRTARKIMQIPQLKAYQGPGGAWCCERYLFEELVNDVQRIGSLKSMYTCC